MNKKFFRHYSGVSGHLELFRGPWFTKHQSTDLSHIMIAPLTYPLVPFPHATSIHIHQILVKQCLEDIYPHEIVFEEISQKAIN